jgi:hypothetical protein
MMRGNKERKEKYFNRYLQMIFMENESIDFNVSV